MSHQCEQQQCADQRPPTETVSTLPPNCLARPPCLPPPPYVDCLTSLMEASMSCQHEQQHSADPPVETTLTLSPVSPPSLPAPQC